MSVVGGGGDLFVSAPGAAGIIDPESNSSATGNVEGAGTVFVADDRSRRLLEAILLELQEHTRILHAMNPGIEITDGGSRRTVEI